MTALSGCQFILINYIRCDKLSLQKSNIDIICFLFYKFWTINSFIYSDMGNESCCCSCNENCECKKDCKDCSKKCCKVCFIVSTCVISVIASMIVVKLMAPCVVKKAMMKDI